MSATMGLGTLGGAGGRRHLDLSRCALVVLSGAERGRRALIERDVFRIGKHPDNDLVLSDETVSRRHCEIVRDPRGYLLRDLGSTNGTLLDGAEIREAYLRSGAVVTVGKVELQVKPFAERIELLPSEKESFGEAVGRSVAMRTIFGLLERLAPTEATILLTGETGTGKDVLARAVHEHSQRREGPFVVVDCGAVVGSLIESELFGHERGAFTGATERRKGAFELAEGGTLFLDEIGELPLDLQPKLLRAIETRAFKRVGSSREQRADVRIVAATKRPLRMEVERGKFREDLYFRLAVVPIELPPLRERPEDVPLVAERLLVRFAAREGVERPPRLSERALDALRAHEWPGNVRELRNVLERAALLARAMGREEIGPADVPLWGSVPPGGRTPEGEGPPPFEPGKSYRETKAAWEEWFERRFVTWLLERHGGNVSAAARDAGMDRKHLTHLARKHGVAVGRRRRRSG